MTTASAANIHNGDAPEAEKLCGLLLEIVGRGPGRMASARRHARVLDAAMPHMNKTQWQEARRRILALETRWGPMLSGDENEPEIDGIPPEMRVAIWLSKRPYPNRYLRALYRAASILHEGETCLLDVMGYAFAREIDHVPIPVGFDSFQEWMIELRIAKRAGKGVHVPGRLCAWWVNEMAPTKDKTSMYHVCFDLREQIRGEGKWTC